MSDRITISTPPEGNSPPGRKTKIQKSFTADEVLRAFDAYYKALEEAEEVDPSGEDNDSDYYSPGDRVDWFELSDDLQSTRDYSVYPPRDKRKGREIPGLGRVTVAAEYGGEGQGDDLWVVFKVSDQYFRKDGYYSSYNGSSWEGDFTEVHPKEKVVTVYE